MFFRGWLKALRLLNRADFCVIVVTNQRCIAKGLMTRPDLEKMHQRMCEFPSRGWSYHRCNLLLSARTRAIL